jgi:hypothetical protein
MTKMARSFKYIPFAKLVLINDLAIKRGANMTLEPKMIVANFNKDTRFPIARGYFHNDDEMRAEIIINDEGRTVLLDIPLTVYNKLPMWYAPDDTQPDDLEDIFADAPVQTQTEELEDLFR